MNTISCHLILEHLIELELEREEDAHRYQQELSRIVRQRLLPIFDNVCAGTDPDTVYRIDTLELDLGELDPEHWEKQLTERVQAQFSLKLREAVRQLQQSGAPEKQPVSGPFELLRFFLRTASLPWWADNRNPDILKDSVEQLLRQQPAALLSLLRAVVEKEAHLKRLIYSLPDRLLAQLAALAAGRSPDTTGTNFPDAIHSWAAAFDGGEGIPVQNVRLEVWKAIFYGLLTPSGVPDNAAQWAIFLELHLRQSLHPSQQAPLRKLCTVLAQWLFPSVVNPAEKKRPSQHSMELRKDASERQQPGDKPASDLPKNDLEKPEPTTKRDTPSTFERRKDASERQQPEDKLASESWEKNLKKNQPTTKRDIPSTFHHNDELHLSNAGLILLWPFLTRFFENLSLVKDKIFVNEQAPHRAIALLQFLVDGATEAPEFLLPLNKVLCGLRPDALYEAGIELLPEEQDASLPFLEAVIGNAPILHNMSVDGFRNTFLRRTGMLSVEDDHWLLHVERQTYDVVLERFPWSFNIVKLPWMERPMYVDW